MRFIRGLQKKYAEEYQKFLINQWIRKQETWKKYGIKFEYSKNGFL